MALTTGQSHFTAATGNDPGQTPILGFLKPKTGPWHEVFRCANTISEAEYSVLYDQGKTDGLKTATPLLKDIEKRRQNSLQHWKTLSSAEHIKWMSRRMDEVDYLRAQIADLPEDFMQDSATQEALRKSILEGEKEVHCFLRGLYQRDWLTAQIEWERMEEAEKAAVDEVQQLKNELQAAKASREGALKSLAQAEERAENLQQRLKLQVSMACALAQQVEGLIDKDRATFETGRNTYFAIHAEASRQFPYLQGAILPSKDEDDLD